MNTLFSLLELTISLSCLLFIALMFLILYLILNELEFTSKSTNNVTKQTSYMIATKESKFFLKAINKFYKEFKEVVKNKKISFFNNSNVHIRNDNISVSFKDANPTKEILKILPEIEKLVNSLDSFSLFFVNRIADEKIAFTVVGRDYCRIVKKIMPFIYPCYEYSNNTNYKSIIELFTIWNSRLEKNASYLKN